MSSISIHTIQEEIKKESTTMTYKIKPEYLSLWGEDATEETILTEADVTMIARGWEKPVADVLGQLIPLAPKQISLDNGNSYMTTAEAIPEILRRNLWETVVSFMDADLAEQIHTELAPCTEEDFLTRYLELAANDLIIG